MLDHRVDGERRACTDVDRADGEAERRAEAAREAAQFSVSAQRCKGDGANSLKWEMTEEWKWLVNAINNQRQNRTRTYF